MNKGIERKHNLSAVIDVLQRYGALTQSQLKDHCGLLASTLSYAVSDLKQFGFVIDLGQAPPDGKPGKPGSLISLNNQIASFLGIYAEDNFLDAQLIGLDETSLFERRLYFDGLEVEEALLRLIHESLKEYPQIRGIGVAIKGIVYHDGTIRSGKRRDKKGSESYWNFMGLSCRLKEAFPQLVIEVENDANCAAVEYHHLDGREKANLIVYLLNKNPFGVGCGILIKGELYRGARGAAGEYFEKDSRLRDLAENLEGKEDFINRYIPAILPHVLETTWLLDPQSIILSGSYFDALDEKDIKAAEALFEHSPVSVSVKGGLDVLNPARGAALLVADSYVTGFIEEVKKR